MRLMGPIGLIGPMGLMGLIGLMGLASCSGEQDGPGVQEWEMAIETSMLVRQFEEAETTQNEEADAVTRAWDPTPYYLYDELYEPGLHYTSLTGRSIDAFLTKGTDATLHGRLRRKGDGKWKLTLNFEPTLSSIETYYVYGFIPGDAADNATIDLLPESSDYAAGARLTIHGMKAIANDPCVIIGAKEGPNENSDNGLKAGDFAFVLDARQHEEGGVSVISPNYLYLLFDHLYSALCISMKVHYDYAALRTIKLKKIELLTYVGASISKEKSDVTITLVPNAEGQNPITSLEFTPTGNDASAAAIFTSSDEAGVTLSTEYSSYMGHFMPANVSRLDVTCTYDVYDKNVTTEHPDGNLIRKDCTATNRLEIHELFSGQSTTIRGRRYNVKLTIEPTYLYVLSEPDLDNPTVTVE